jgi:hypothetical protein
MIVNESILQKSVPIRIYFNREVAERLGKLSDVSGLNFSTIVNAAAKVGLERPSEIIKDAEGAQLKWTVKHK